MKTIKLAKALLCALLCIGLMGGCPENDGSVSSEKATPEKTDASLSTDASDKTSSQEGEPKAEKGDEVSYAPTPKRGRAEVARDVSEEDCVDWERPVGEGQQCLAHAPPWLQEGDVCVLTG